MRGMDMWVFALLALGACASNGQSGSSDPSLEGLGTAAARDVPRDPSGFAGMSAPNPNETASDTFTDPDAPASPDPMEGDADTFVGDGSMSDTPDGEAGSAPASSANAGASASDSTDPSPSTPTTPQTPTFTSLADLEPAADNIPECPATAPEDPWGPCAGVPVYAVCNYGTEPAPFYSCICDWIHWICVGVQ